MCQQMDLVQVSHILEDVLGNCIWEAGSCSSSSAPPGCCEFLRIHSRNVLAGATSSAALLQPMGGRDTAPARLDFRASQKKWSLGTSSGPADPKGFLDPFNASRGTSLGSPSSLNLPLLLSLSVLSHWNPKSPSTMCVPCRTGDSMNRSVTRHRAYEVMQQGECLQAWCIRKRVSATRWSHTPPYV